MAFPTNPSNNDIVAINGIDYKYSSVNKSWMKISQSYINMTLSERKQYKQLATSTNKLRVRDTDLNLELVYNRNCFYQYSNRYEDCTFPTNPTDQDKYTSPSSKIEYTYDLASDYWSCSLIATKDCMGLISSTDKDKLDKMTAPAKNNLTATVPPTVNDGVNNGYSVGSIWVYNSVTYTCVDSTLNSAKWVSSADIFYFDDWSSAVSAISVAGSNFVQKYISLVNANGAPSSGATYVSSSGAVTNPISDGNSAILYVIQQGNPYSVTCMKRTITNPILTSMVKQGDSLPSISGYYGFLGMPTGGYPASINQGDIGFYDGSTWSRFQNYSSASNNVLVGSGTSQIVWYKQSGTWSNAYTKVTLPNQTTNVTLTASTTVDIAEFIEINQTTSNISITIPPPTITANTRRLILMNTGTATLFLNNGTMNLLNPNDIIILIWSPSKNSWLNPEIQLSEKYWQPNTHYMSNYKVVYNGTILTPAVDHVSSSNFKTDFQAGKWFIIGGLGISMTLDEKLGITNPYDGMRVTLSGTSLAGEWVYSAYYSCWRHSNIDSITPHFVTNEMAKPTYDAVFVFAGTPIDGFPTTSGGGTISRGDMVMRLSGLWYRMSSYNALPSSMYGYCANGGQLELWRKTYVAQLSWVVTSDDYIPDGNEYMTSKRYNGKIVYRKCMTGTTSNTISTNYNCYFPGLTFIIPSGYRIILIGGTITSSDGKIFSINDGQQYFFLNTSTRIMQYYLNSSAMCNQQYTIWAEYTKS